MTNESVNITYDQLIAITSTTASAGSEIIVEVPGFDEGESVTIVVTDPETGDIVTSYTGIVEDGKVRIRIPANTPEGEKKIEVKSNVVPDKLVTTGINITSRAWDVIGGIILLVVLVILFAIMRSKKSNIS